MGPSISFPPSESAAIETLDGSNWPSWASHITALLCMNGLKNHLTESPPATATTTNASGLITTVIDKDWVAKEEMVLGVLKMYTQKDVWTTVSNDSMYKTCKAK